MNKKYLYAIGAVFLALSGIGTTANAATKKVSHHYRPKTERVNSFYGNYFVNAPAAVKTGTRTISGTASRGIHVILKSSANSKRILASTYASKNNGQYHLTIPAKYTNKNGKICVMAKKGYFYPYRYVTIKSNLTKKTNKKVNPKRSTQKINRKNNKKATTKKNSKKAKSKRSKAAKKVRKTNKSTKKNSKKGQSSRSKVNKKSQKTNQNVRKNSKATSKKTVHSKK